jgi:polysaccharide biosynthesis/export protein
MNRVIKIAALLLVSTLATMTLAQADDASKNAAAQSAAAAEVTPGAMQASGTDSDYKIGSDDALKISVWKEPDLTESLPVRPDGKISMPLLGDVVAAGLTPGELGLSITEKLKKYIADPRVTVVVTAMNSRRVFVTGEVVHSGAMPLLPHMTVLQALSAAGFTQFANVKDIYVLRADNGKQTKLPFNYKEVVKGRHSEQNIPLKPGDTVVVP